MEDNSQKGDGSGDTGWKTYAGGAKETVLGESKACLPQQTPITSQTLSTPAPGASGDVGHASGLEIERGCNAGNVANVPTPGDVNTSGNTASGHRDNSCHSNNGREQGTGTSSPADDSTDKPTETNFNPTPCKSSPPDNLACSEVKSGVVEGTDTKQKLEESSGEDKESVPVSESGSEIPQASLSHTSSFTESLSHLSTQSVLQTRQLPADNTKMESQLSECKSDYAEKDKTQTQSESIAVIENSVINAPDTIQSKNSHVTDQNLISEKQSGVSAENDNLTSEKEKFHEKSELRSPACAGQVSLQPECGGSTEKSQNEVPATAGDAENPCLSTSKTAEVCVCFCHSWVNRSLSYSRWT